tara:strand:+ start:1301 stop:1780 length:480 start_codon:yes stop_codon:yes gene_type:complete
MAFTKYKSYKQGLKSELKFASFCNEKGLDVRRSRESMDITSHVDFMVSFLVDIKGMKRIERTNNTLQDTWMWLELKNVMGDPGWVYGLETEMIAFEVKEGWLMVVPAALQKLIKDKVDFTQSVNDPYDARYILYTRPSRKDLITMVEKEELLKIGWLWK